MRKQLVGNMRVGSRFAYAGHSSMMIRTDLQFKSAGQVKHLCVSENGYIEWLSADTEVSVIPSVARDEVIGVSNKFLNAMFGQGGK